MKLIENWEKHEGRYMSIKVDWGICWFNHVHKLNMQRKKSKQKSTNGKHVDKHKNFTLWNPREGNIHGESVSLFLLLRYGDHNSLVGLQPFPNHSLTRLIFLYGLTWIYKISYTVIKTNQIHLWKLTKKLTKFSYGNWPKNCPKKLPKKLTN